MFGSDEHGQYAIEVQGFGPADKGEFPTIGDPNIVP